MISILYIALGGALGAVCRHGLNIGVTNFLKQPFPFGTLGANVIGSLAMGVLVATFARYGHPSQEMRLFLTVGFLGSFTTFSTFSLDAMTLAGRGEISAAAMYVFASLVLSIGAVVLGSYLVWKFPA